MARPQRELDLACFRHARLGIYNALLLFHAIEDSLSLHLDARGWCDEVFVNLILPLRAQDAFLVLIATQNRNRYH